MPLRKEGKIRQTIAAFWDNDVACDHLLTTIILGAFGAQLFGGKQMKSPAFIWFTQTWPYTQLGWAIALTLAAMVSASAFFVWPSKPKSKISYADAWHIFAAGVLVAGHLIIAEGCFMANWHSTGTVTYSVAALFGLRVMARIYRGDRIWPAESYGLGATTAGSGDRNISSFQSH